MIFYKFGDFGCWVFFVFIILINFIIMKFLFIILVVVFGLFVMSIVCFLFKDFEKILMEEVLVFFILDIVQYKKQGMEIVMGIFKVFSGQFKVVMQEGGVKNVAQYCNIVVYLLVDSFFGQYNV